MFILSIVYSLPVYLQTVYYVTVVYVLLSLHYKGLTNRTQGQWTGAETYCSTPGVDSQSSKRMDGEQREDRDRDSIMSERKAGHIQLLDFIKAADIFHVNNSSPSSNEDRKHNGCRSIADNRRDLRSDTDGHSDSGGMIDNPLITHSISI
jgi:hypothetical protein